KETLWHVRDVLDNAAHVDRFSVENPIAAFGREPGGSPLYSGEQTYAFAPFAGVMDETKAGCTNVFRLLVFRKDQFVSASNNVVPIATTNFVIPRRTISADSNAYSAFVSNGLSVVVESFGLR